MILVVEDDPFYSFLLQETFKLNNLPLLKLNTAEDALTELHKRNDIQMVVTDIGLPGVDGIELCRRIKNDPKLKSLPVLMMTTTHAGKADIEDQCEDAGADKFMIKPDDPGELCAAIKRMIPS